MNVVVTGAGGFIGRHLAEALARAPGVSRLTAWSRSAGEDALAEAVGNADAVFHLAGVNRPLTEAEFDTGNRLLTAKVCQWLEAGGRRPWLALASSRQATQDNPYGRSKQAAEESVRAWAERSGGRATIFRLQNVFGKWCRPNYNSVVATFCHNIARDLPITVSDPAKEIELVYVDDVVAGLLEAWRDPPKGCARREITPTRRVTLGRLADLIRSFRESRRTLLLPSFDDDLTRQLYVTYLSYLEGPEFSYALQQRSDPRGTLAEFMKSPPFGQIFVSRTNPGVTRGNHYHHSKTEKFLVVEGEAVVRFRALAGTQIVEHRVNGREFRVVDIPPGYTHSIENVGAGELVTLFWASEVFDPTRADTFPLPVQEP